MNEQLDDLLNKYVSNYNLEVLGFRESGQHTLKQSLLSLIKEEKIKELHHLSNRVSVLKYDIDDRIKELKESK